MMRDIAQTLLPRKVAIYIIIGFCVYLRIANGDVRMASHIKRADIKAKDVGCAQIGHSLF